MHYTFDRGGIKKSGGGGEKDSSITSVLVIMPMLSMNITRIYVKSFQSWCIIQKNKKKQEKEQEKEQNKREAWRPDQRSL